jgi:hypothetical protein
MTRPFGRKISEDGIFRSPFRSHLEFEVMAFRVSREAIHRASSENWLKSESADDFASVSRISFWR